MGSVKKPIKIFARLKPLRCDPAVKITHNTIQIYNKDVAYYKKHGMVCDGLQIYNIETVEGDETNDEILVFTTRNPNYPSDELFNHSKYPEVYRYRYSKVFDRDTSQEQMFDAICRPVLDSAISGYNGTIFAYGQTGSGKTFTMTGSRSEYDERGIIPRSLSYVFQKFQEQDHGSVLQGVYVSYLEIYNENGYDLLNSGFVSGRLEDLSKVVLMEDGSQQIHLKNLSVHPVASEDEALQLFYLGEHTRTVAETPMNEASTRSHCIFTVHLNIRDVKDSVVRRSKVHLVDLAGSERIANSNISGVLLNEARHINLALHYLEQVIVALGEANRTHIPYRNSMMTSILRDSLGGNCMTSMIATLSLEPKNVPETLSTCRFSQRVALVTNAATLNEQVDPDMLIAQLKTEIKKLKATIASSAIKPISDTPAPLTADEVTDCWNTVRSYLSDPDENSIMAVVPDMRLIQTCFRCLKMACNLSKSKGALQMMQYNLPDTEKFPQAEKVKELRKIVATRDAEIKVLRKMLQQEKEKNAKVKFAAISGVDVRPSTDEQSDHDKVLEFKKSGEVLDDLEEKLRNPPYSPERISTSEAEKADDRGDNIFPDVNEAKKRALDLFVKSYVITSDLGELKKGVVDKRAVCKDIEEQMKPNLANLSQIELIINTPRKLGCEDETKNEVLVGALVAQKRTLGMQQERLDKAKEDLSRTESKLKHVYDKMMGDFEHWWTCKEAEGRYEDLSGIVSDKPMHGIATGFMKKSEMETNSSSLRSGFTRRDKGDKDSHCSSWSRNQQQNENSKAIAKPKTPRLDEHDESLSKTSSRKGLLGARERKDEVEDYLSSDGFYTSYDDQNTGYDTNDEEKKILTGDVSVDTDIIKFFKTRQAVFKKINATKQANQQIPSVKDDDSC